MLKIILHFSLSEKVYTAATNVILLYRIDLISSLLIVDLFLIISKSFLIFWLQFSLIIKGHVYYLHFKKVF